MKFLALESIFGQAHENLNAGLARLVVILNCVIDHFLRRCTCDVFHCRSQLFYFW